MGRRERLIGWGSTSLGHQDDHADHLLAASAEGSNGVTTDVGQPNGGGIFQGSNTAGLQERGGQPLHDLDGSDDGHHGHHQQRRHVPDVRYLREQQLRRCGRKFEFDGTAATPDTTPLPIQPAGTDAREQDGHRRSVAWTATTDNVGVTQYNSSRDDVAHTVGDGRTLSYADSGLTASTATRTPCRRSTPAGNSSTSAALTVTTNARPIQRRPFQPAAPTLVSEDRYDSPPSPGPPRLTTSAPVTQYKLFRGTTLLTTVAAGGTFSTATASDRIDDVRIHGEGVRRGRYSSTSTR